MGRPKLSSPSLDGNFKDCAIAMEQLISKLKHMEIAQAKLYFCTKEQMAFARGLQAQLEDIFTTKNDAKYFGFSRIANLLNPSIVTHTYDTGVRAKYRHIIDAAKVRRDLDGEFARWKNITRKRAEEFITTHSLKDEEAEHYIQEVQNKIVAGQSQYDFVKNNFTDFEVRIVGYGHAKSYPYITFFENKKKIVRHLSIKVPNLLMLKLDTYRSNMEAADFVNNGINAFGDVYYFKSNPKKD